MNFDEKTTDQRLAEHRCVWCGYQLDDASPDRTFCCDSHQTAWHRAKNGDTGGYQIADLMEGWDQVGPTDMREAFGALADLVIDDMVRQAETNARYGDLIDIPRDRDDSRRAEGEDVMIREHERARRDGKIAPTPTQTNQITTTVGHSMIGGRPALVEIEREPELVPYPHIALAELADQGIWRRPTGALRPLRQCQSCGQTTDPSTEPLNYPRLNTIDTQFNVSLLWQSELIEPQVAPIRLAKRTRIICTACRHEYEGVPIVPLISRAPRIDVWSLAGVTARGVFYQQVTGEVIRSVAPSGIDCGVLWGGVYDRALREACPYGCMVVGCTDRALHWMALSAPMTYRACVWVPTDGVPIRIGMCTMHHHYLQRDLWSDPSMSMRVQPGMMPTSSIIID